MHVELLRRFALGNYHLQEREDLKDNIKMDFMDTLRESWNNILHCDNA
jgi:hypothetical protein